ncbi:REP element-mobilizing transposase RayT [Algoriphagus ratkowskyi]|uniref:IS200/IS605 family transposase n=1 Tax=Algoriphagus ratkowskyi TaxID=57028 RepID=A0A2W7R589_9BACT|nr:IS200/IS605 family transposase [Algoriphagus ratkowskyi]PZX55331.1 REP element-mobilizing transposase RayT [Algoriphagus ratkowskyi]TXD79738.1 IS200/IS605 family transposase [Algoriphagus ratkowskyi]
MSFVKVYIHFVWSTKNRYPYMNSKELRTSVWNHIQENGRAKGIFVDFINGHIDHCHCLISLGLDQTIEKTVMLLKGESSFWINKNKLTQKKFEWQDEYFAVSVSESQLDKVRNYIKNQEDHHQTKTFSDEYEEFLVKYGFQKLKDGLG